MAYLKIPTLILFFSTPFFLKLAAQKSSYQITYRHCVQTNSDKTLLKGYEGFEAVLTGSTEYSNYVFAKLPKVMKPDTTLMKYETLENLRAKKQSGTAIAKVGISADTVGSMVLFNKQKNTYSVREKVPSGYLLLYEEKPVINWQITDSVKTILNHSCKMATAAFRGRNYTAWFAPDIPIVDGPWKFKDLPGLILDVEDELEQVHLFAVAIEIPAKKEVEPFYPSGKKVTLVEMINYLSKELNEHLAKMQAELDGQEHIQYVQEKPTVRANFKVFGIEKALN